MGSEPRQGATPLLLPGHSRPSRTRLPRRSTRAASAPLLGVLAALSGPGDLLGQAPLLENDWVRVTADAAPCASPTLPFCGERVIVALGEVEIVSAGSSRRLPRGGILVFGEGEAHEPPRGGPYFEVAIKPGHPPGDSPGELILPEKNQVVHDSPGFFVFEESLAVGDTRARHSHSQRVVVQLNATRLQQWPDGQPEILRDIVPDGAGFNPPVLHTVKNVGDLPLRGIVIEFKTPDHPGRP